MKISSTLNQEVPQEFKDSAALSGMADESLKKEERNENKTVSDEIKTPVVAINYPAPKLSERGFLVLDIKHPDFVSKADKDTLFSDYKKDNFSRPSPNQVNYNSWLKEVMHENSTAAKIFSQSTIRTELKENLENKKSVSAAVKEPEKDDPEKTIPAEEPKENKKPLNLTDKEILTRLFEKENTGTPYVEWLENKVISSLKNSNEKSIDDQQRVLF